MSKKYPWPLTVVCDRYGGVYSGANFIAWNLEPDCVPMDSQAGDGTCSDFWDDNERVVGRGHTADLAIDDLIENMRKNDDR